MQRVKCVCTLFVYLHGLPVWACEGQRGNRTKAVSENSEREESNQGKGQSIYHEMMATMNQKQGEVRSTPNTLSHTSPRIHQWNKLLLLLSMYGRVSACLCFTKFVSVHVIDTYLHIEQELFSQKRRRQSVCPHLRVPQMCSRWTHLDVARCFRSSCFVLRSLH